ncbi:MAG: hypothetical protein U9Q82_07075 [Chloroflexota bacterium]|nr:hypothetical protein [Chloroflexota bacterium]
MDIKLTDEEIQDLINEPKILPDNYRDRLRTKPKRGHKEADLDVHGENGSKFRIIIRQSSLDPFDFSVILGYKIPKTNVLFRLRRYNGKSHEHTNKLENMRFFDFHIHQATLRYQQFGLSEDEYAEVTNEYADLHGAIQSLLTECSFILPPNTQLSF